MLKGHEGLELKPYLDTEGKLTIGYGRNLSDIGISLEEAEVMLTNDINEASKRAQSVFPWFSLLDTVRQDVIVMMVFNMGVSRVTQFLRMIDAIKKGEWERAAEEMLNSLWARQVGRRALILSRMMRLGKYPEA